ncbi:MAG: hypothetical protein IH597_14910 [Bacteroidales bacterium]|nr:hypothetical protein [Bacteroidales bacterium]
MSIIKSIQDLQQYVRVNVSVMEKSFLPYANDASEKFLNRYIGEALLTELDTHHNSTSTPLPYPAWADNDEKKAIFRQVLKLAQNALAKFTLLLASPHYDLQLTEMGFVVQQNSNTTPASAERVKKAVESYESQGWDNMETLLRYLEKHHAIITSYKDSDAFVLATRNLINTAEVFDRYVNIEASRLKFIKLRPAMDDVELINIEPVISVALADALRTQQRENSLTDDNKKLLPILQRAIANLVAAREMKKEGAEHYGNHYLVEAKKLLDKDPDKYPLYKESEQYVATKTGYAYHENTEEAKNFVFGG